MLDHGEAKVLITDREFSRALGSALSMCEARPLVIDVDDPGYTGPGVCLGETDYETFLATGDPAHVGSAPQDEWDAIALNYTSGTTGSPKGVVYHHRGAYLAALGTVLAGAIPRYAVFLWTAPMFHCNGWCFPWAVAALAGTGVCLRKVEAATILALIREHKVTHFGGAPIVHSLLLNASAELSSPAPRRRWRRSRQWSAAAWSSRTVTASPRPSAPPLSACGRRNGARSRRARRPNGSVARASVS